MSARPFHRPLPSPALAVKLLGALVAGCASSAPDSGRAVAVAASTAPVDSHEEPRPDSRTSIELAFVTHLEMGMPEQDVFIEREPGAPGVFRVTQGDNDMSAPLFKTAVRVPHNPFDAGQIGPHPRGEPLGLTLGQWLAHRGTGVYTAEGGVGHLDLEFSGLVPGGVYTLWHAFTAIPPTTPFSGALELPLGARDGSESVFVADDDGRARFRHSFTPELEMSDVWTRSMLALNYHSDGRTWGGLPGDFGLNAHVPLFVMLPFREGLE